MKIDAVVNGAGGYIGVRLVKTLRAKGRNVLAVDFPAALERLDRFDNCILRLCTQSNGAFPAVPDGYDISNAVFYHLAWIGKAGPLRADCEIQIENVRTAIVAYRAAVRAGCGRFVCTGTIGERMEELPECAAIRPANIFYIHAKAFLRRILEDLETPECPLIWATLGNLYGEGLSGGGLIEYALKTLARGEKALFGPGGQPYDFIEAEDCAEALARLGFAAGARGRYYVGTGRPRKLKEWLLEIGRALGLEHLICIGERPDDGTRFREEWFNVSALEAATGFRPSSPFTEGIVRAFADVKRRTGDGRA